jgi:hypothetical protein
MIKDNNLIVLTDSDIRFSRYHIAKEKLAVTDFYIQLQDIKSASVVMYVASKTLLTLIFKNRYGNYGVVTDFKNRRIDIDR